MNTVDTQPMADARDLDGIDLCGLTIVEIAALLCQHGAAHFAILNEIERVFAGRTIDTSGDFQ